MPRSLRLPDRLFLAALLRRAFFIWLLPRAFLTFAAAAAADEPGRPSLLLSFDATLGLLLLAGLLGLLEARRRNEHLLLANLGVSQPTIAAVCAVPAAAAEALAWTISALARA